MDRLQEERIFAEIAGFDTPTISNALECFKGANRMEGFLDSTIHSAIACSGTRVGRAVTSRISTAREGNPQGKTDIIEYYRYIQNMGKGCISVQEDIDPKPVGSFWGEVNVTQHLAFGCQGVVTSGGVRDLNEVEHMNFGYFSSCVVVSHCYAHMESFDCDVSVGGVTVHSGDVIACDRHGVIHIPEKTLPYLAEACREISVAELPVLEPLRRAIMAGEKVNLEDFRKWRQQMSEARKKVYFEV